jgi:ribonuclease BN (tRNA processing enzyme)
VDFCRDLLDVFHLRDKKFKRRVDLIALEPDKRIPVGEALEVSAFSTPHSSASLAYHFYFKGEGKELLYSGDTPPMPRLIQEAAGIDYLVHDSSSPARFFQQYPILKTMHTHSLELGALARKADVKCLIPIHFFGEVEFSLTEIEEEIRENFQGRLIVPRDFDIVPL